MNKTTLTAFALLVAYGTSYGQVLGGSASINDAATVGQLNNRLGALQPIRTAQRRSIGSVPRRSLF